MLTPDSVAQRTTQSKQLAGLSTSLVSIVCSTSLARIAAYELRKILISEILPWADTTTVPPVCRRDIAAVCSITVSLHIETAPLVDT